MDKVFIEINIIRGKEVISKHIVPAAAMLRQDYPTWIVLKQDELGSAYLAGFEFIPNVHYVRK